MFSFFDRSEIDIVRYTPKKGNAHSTVLTPRDFADAAKEIKAWNNYTPTPLLRLTSLASELNVKDILYKDEGPRFGLGSFKALGGAYAALKILRREIDKKQTAIGLAGGVTLEDVREGRFAKEASNITLVSATDGNHGRSLAWGCHRFGAPCRIYIHAEVSEGRATAMRKLGATVIRIKGDYDASVRLARLEAEKNGWFVVSDTSWEGYTDPPRDVMAGYGVMVGEIAENLKMPPTHVFLQGGVGGLAASVCAAFRQYWGDSCPRVIIVEPDRAACLFESAKAGETKTVKIERETVMAGLSCGEPSDMAWSILKEEAQDFMTITDEVVVPTLRLLKSPVGTDPVVEAGESAVAGLAATILASRREELRDALEMDGNSVIVVVGSEGITDPAVHAELMKEADHA
ncbi:diaminopropionate ammonia-lyase [Sneathiella marina]|uniref:Diaminopropionate ammonia-lyase n=1 Tax=Sneathiella marina TaxID=2950108 RepID=A0ABY4W5P1_9PROT|nr:diaminopropionate ammonia-lyase [Sneathiella marina]USG62505.1 diaminopropionate ammonia-lyase [Sneathiella marina]